MKIDNLSWAKWRFVKGSMDIVVLRYTYVLQEFANVNRYDPKKNCYLDSLTSIVTPDAKN